MRLLQCSTPGGCRLTEPFTEDEVVPRYAILSHTWGKDGEEVTFDDLMKGTGAHKSGYKKIRFCQDQATRDGLDYFWIDTCCINKANKAELSRAINSMFDWYRTAHRCYVYLSDVSAAKYKVDNEDVKWLSELKQSRWFTRGWTLQELLAPRNVEFFSRDCRRLGDRNTLRKQIHEATAIPEAVLRGQRLSQFSVNDRLSWIEHRETHREEDRAYSLLGIFGVYMPPIYGEGVAKAFDRLKTEIDKLEECTRDLYVTNPQHDKARIEETKGGLLKQSYQWILRNPEFQKWRDSSGSRLLWIKGDPGKGKTMLLCGIINEIRESTANEALLSYFFCQATDSRIDSATAVLRGLLFMLVKQQPSLISHFQKKYDQTGKEVFNDVNAWIVLCEIFTDVLQDPRLSSTYFFIDALDECVQNLDKLLAFISQKASLSSHTKWILTSRNYTNVEQKLRLDNSGTRLSLELDENAAQVSNAVAAYIDHRILELEHIQYDNALQLSVREVMKRKANGTFLWVSLIMRELKDAFAWEVLQILEEVPTGLVDVYRRMLKQIKQLRHPNSEICRRVLSTVITTYRPLHLREFCVLADLPDDGPSWIATTLAIVNMCGSFLTVRENHVYTIHQSAKDFLLDEASSILFPCGISEAHNTVFLRSIRIMSGVLRRDIYGLNAPGYATARIKQPDPDPLLETRYSCLYWIDHLLDRNLSGLYQTDDHSSKTESTGSVIETFLTKTFLYWLEALSLFKSMSKGVISMAMLQASTKDEAATPLNELVQDAYRFITYYRAVIERNPLQVYASALLFSPQASLVRGAFDVDRMKTVVIKPQLEHSWSRCLQTLESHGGFVFSAAFSHDSKRLASSSADGIIRIWNTLSGECLTKLEGHTDEVNSVAFSRESLWLASGSNDMTVRIWNANSAECVHELIGHKSRVHSVAFSDGLDWLASASHDKTVKLWDARSGKCQRTLQGHNGNVNSVAFCGNTGRLASAASDGIIRIWDINNGECMNIIGEHGVHLSFVAVAFSHDSSLLAAALKDGRIRIWDTSNDRYLQTLEIPDNLGISSIAFARNSSQLASAFSSTIKIWNPSNGQCLQTLRGHQADVNSVNFSHDSNRLVSVSWDSTAKIWDVSHTDCLPTRGSHSDTISEAMHETMEGQHSSAVRSVAFSPNSYWLASASWDGTVKVWDSNGECMHTLSGHKNEVYFVGFAPDSTRIVSASTDFTARIWDTNSGKCLQTLKGHSEWFQSVTFACDARRLASVSAYGTCKVWDVDSGACLCTFESAGLNPNYWNGTDSVAFSPDAAQLAVANGIDIEIWDMHSLERVQVLSGHSDEVFAVAFSRDSRRVASASDDNTIKIWDARNGTCLQTFMIGRVLRRVSFSTCGLYLRTDIGTIDISAVTDQTSFSVHAEVQTPQYRGLGLSADCRWITYNSENLVWIPAEYRSFCSAVSETSIGVGCEDGRVWRCEASAALLENGGLLPAYN